MWPSSWLCRPSALSSFCCWPQLGEFHCEASWCRASAAIPAGSGVSENSLHFRFEQSGSAAALNLRKMHAYGPDRATAPPTPTIPQSDILRRLAALERTPPADLKRLWRELFGKEPPAFSRTHLATRLARRIQERLRFDVGRKGRPPVALSAYLREAHSLSGCSAHRQHQSQTRPTFFGSRPVLARQSRQHRCLPVRAPKLRTWHRNRPRQPCDRYRGWRLHVISLQQAASSLAEEAGGWPPYSARLNAIPAAKAGA